MIHFSDINFVRQQGFRDAGAETCVLKFPALMIQPKLIGIVVLVGVVLQSAALFICLSLILFWSALLPALSPFDALYNFLIARPKNRPLLTPAPAPRRFAQAMAATLTLAIGIFFYAGLDVAAWIIEGFLVLAISALIFGKFCVGSYIFLLLRHDTAFANRTLPWTRDPK